MVSVAHSGARALEMMSAERFDLVFLDLLMPEMDGYEVLQRIAAGSRLRGTPVIVLTAVQDRSSVVKCMQLGAKDYVVKPIDMPTVKSRLWRCLESERLLKRHPEPPGGDEGREARILIVDDDEVNRDLLKRRCRGAGYQAVCVSRGTEALEHIGSEAFDLVLLDIMMEGMDGFELLQRIKTDERLKRVPVIMVSALDDTQSIGRCLGLGAEDYLTKPFNAVELQARVGSCIQLKRLQEREATRRARLSEFAELGEVLKQEKLRS